MFENEIRWLIDEKYRGIKTAEAQKDIERLKAGEPVAYVIGFVEFCGAKVDLSRRPMIPRPETEFWAGEAIAELKKKEGDLRVMDVFAGSGCVGIAVLRHLPHALVEFLERNASLLQQIQINLEINRIDASRAKLIESDMLSGATGRYDAILANPPYVNAASLSPQAKRELSLEPAEALYASEEGFSYVRKTICEAPRFLKSGGLLYCEMDDSQSSRVAEYKNLFREFSVRNDQYGRRRYIRAII